MPSTRNSNFPFVSEYTDLGSLICVKELIGAKLPSVLAPANRRFKSNCIVCRSTIHVLFPGCSYTTLGQHGMPSFNFDSITHDTPGKFDVCMNWPRDRHELAVHMCLQFEELHRRDTTHLFTFVSPSVCACVSWFEVGNVRARRFQFLGCRICRDFFWFWSQIFFWPIRCDFLLFRLVGGWLWCGTTFGDVCHPKKITLPLVFALASVYVRCSVTMPKKFFKNPQKIIKKQIARSLWGCAPPTN